MLLEAMNSHFSVPETGRHHSVHQEACEVTIFDFQATHGQSVGAPTNVRGVLLPVGFSTGPKSRSTCTWPKPQSRHCLAKFGKAGLQLLGHVSSAILEALWCVPSAPESRYHQFASIFQQLEDHQEQVHVCVVQSAHETSWECRKLSWARAVTVQT